MLSSAKRYKSSVKGNFMQAGWISNRKTWIAGSLCSSSSMFQKPKFYSSLFWPEERPFKPRKKGERRRASVGKCLEAREDEDWGASNFPLQRCIVPHPPLLFPSCLRHEIKQRFQMFSLSGKSVWLFKISNPKVCRFFSQNMILWRFLFLVVRGGRVRG